ncbi:MAG: hypothetical protein IT582_09265 [Opitutaceae bacterium]|nr:hypothetical protein [Opitutaceae bacterium]
MAVDRINRANGWTIGNKGLSAWGPAPVADRYTVVFDADGLKISAFAIPNYTANDETGYRFDFHGQSLLVCRSPISVVAIADDLPLLTYDGIRVAGRVYSSQQAPQLVHLNAATSTATVRPASLKEAWPTVAEPTVLRDRTTNVSDHGVTCLGCSAQLEVDTSRTSTGGSVLCANCGHSWFVQPVAAPAVYNETLDEVLLDEPLDYVDADDEDSDADLSDEALLDELPDEDDVGNENAVVCSGCSTRYYLAASRIGDGRTVRCAACGFSWFVEPKPTAKKLVQSPSPKPTMGAVLLVQDYPGLFLVREIISSRQLLVDHARTPDYKITRGISVEDASPANDWSKVKILQPETKQWQSYDARGFLSLAAV